MDIVFSSTLNNKKSVEDACVITMELVEIFRIIANDAADVSE